MKAGYKRRIFLYFFVIFALFTALTVLLEQSQEKEHKTEALKEKLNIYADMVYRIGWQYPDSIPSEALYALFPEQIRITWINSQGAVLYDNTIPHTARFQNHLHRPEIQAARGAEGKGFDRRVSSSNGAEYLYCAKRFGDRYVRVALPYDVRVRHALKPGKLFRYYIGVLFVLVMAAIHWIAGRFGNEIVTDDQTKQEHTRRLKQEMTGNITHELRTPVTGIRGCLETVLEHRLAPETKQYFIESAYRQVLNLSELIQDMSLITKIEEAPQSFKLETVSLDDLLLQLKQELGAQLDEKHIDMQWNTGHALVRGNRNLLYSIFRNLTDNVIRYAGSDLRIIITRYRKDRHFYYFSYADTGVGIPGEQHLSRLFERFYRINEGRTRDTGGSGLGLSIVKNAVAFHHGSITAQNRPGGGLEFLLKLPRFN
jgi:signal transduction histidine kinase